MNRGLIVLTGQIPQGDIDSTELSHHDRATEVRPPIHILPVMLDTERILANEIFRKFIDCRRRGFGKSPGAGLTQPFQTIVSSNFNKQKPIKALCLYSVDAHNGIPGVSLKEGTSHSIRLPASCPETWSLSHGPGSNSWSGTGSPIVCRSGKNAPHHRLEYLKRQCVVARVERLAIPAF